VSPSRVLPLIALSVLVVGCGGDPSATPSPAPTTDAPTATSGPSTAASSTPSAPPATAELPLGDALDPSAVRPGGAGVAWSTPEAVLLTSTSGTPIGHLPGWSLDGPASDRLAAPVLVDHDGTRLVVTADGLAAPADGLPLADGALLVVADGEAVVLDRAGEAATTLAVPRQEALWVSANGSVVGVVDGDHWDVEAAAATAVPAGCRVADRHTPDDPLLVCDEGARLEGGTDVTAPAGSRFGWVTVGTSGDELLATVRSGDGQDVLVGSRGAGDLAPLGPGDDDGAVGLFFRSNGNAWVASLGATGGLDVLTPSGALERVRDLPGVSDARMWTR
jgi:hypothetical protein